MQPWVQKLNQLGVWAPPTFSLNEIHYAKWAGIESQGANFNLITYNELQLGPELLKGEASKTVIAAAVGEGMRGQQVGVVCGSGV